MLKPCHQSSHFQFHSRSREPFSVVLLPQPRFTFSPFSFAHSNAYLPISVVWSPAVGTRAASCGCPWSTVAGGCWTVPSAPSGLVTIPTVLPAITLRSIPPKYEVDHEAVSHHQKRDCINDSAMTAHPCDCLGGRFEPSILGSFGCYLGYNPSNCFILGCAFLGIPFCGISQCGDFFFGFGSHTVIKEGGSRISFRLLMHNHFNWNQKKHVFMSFRFATVDGRIVFKRDNAFAEGRAPILAGAKAKLEPRCEGHLRLVWTSVLINPGDRRGVWWERRSKVRSRWVEPQTFAQHRH